MAKPRISSGLLSVSLSLWCSALSLFPEDARAEGSPEPALDSVDQLSEAIGLLSPGPRCENSASSLERESASITKNSGITCYTRTGERDAQLTQKLDEYYRLLDSTENSVIDEFLNNKDGLLGRDRKGVVTTSPVPKLRAKAEALENALGGRSALKDELREMLPLIAIRTAAYAPTAYHFLYERFNSAGVPKHPMIPPHATDDAAKLFRMGEGMLREANPANRLEAWISASAKKSSSTYPLSAISPERGERALMNALNSEKIKNRHQALLNNMIHLNRADEAGWDRTFVDEKTGKKASAEMVRKEIGNLQRSVQLDIQKAMEDELLPEARARGLSIDQGSSDVRMNVRMDARMAKAVQTKEIEYKRAANFDRDVAGPHVRADLRDGIRKEAAEIRAAADKAFAKATGLYSAAAKPKLRAIGVNSDITETYLQIYRNEIEGMAESTLRNVTREAAVAGRLVGERERLLKNAKSAAAASAVRGKVASSGARRALGGVGVLLLASDLFYSGGGESHFNAYEKTLWEHGFAQFTNEPPLLQCRMIKDKHLGELLLTYARGGARSELDAIGSAGRPFFSHRDVLVQELAGFNSALERGTALPAIRPSRTAQNPVTPKDAFR